VRAEIVVKTTVVMTPRAVAMQVREQMQAEIDKYKRETEEAVTRTVAEMKATLEARLKEKIQLENDRERLEALVAQLQGQVNELQAQVCLCLFHTACQLDRGRPSLVLVFTARSELRN